MSGAQFWITTLIIVGTFAFAYVVGYRTGWTDGRANLRTWANK